MKRLAAVILTASMGLALAGCSGNPYKEGVSQLESKEYKQAEASFKEAVKQDKNTAGRCIPWNRNCLLGAEGI